MSLTAEQSRLVKEVYTSVGLSTTRYAELFYHQLLLNHPFARALFSDDIANQVIVFEQTIDALVANIDDLSRLRTALAGLAQRHVTYGVKAYQYAAVGTVLIETFAQILGSRFTVEARQAWESVYAETAGFMIAEAYPAA